MYIFIYLFLFARFHLLVLDCVASGPSVWFILFDLILISLFFSLPFAFSFIFIIFYFGRWFDVFYATIFWPTFLAGRACWAGPRAADHGGRVLLSVRSKARAIDRYMVTSFKIWAEISSLVVDYIYLYLYIFVNVNQKSGVGDECIYHVFPFFFHFCFTFLQWIILFYMNFSCCMLFCVSFFF